MAKKNKKRKPTQSPAPQHTTGKHLSKTDIFIISIVSITAMLVITLVIYGATRPSIDNDPDSVYDTVDTLISGETDDFGAYFINPEDVMTENDPFYSNYLAGPNED